MWCLIVICDVVPVLLAAYFLDLSLTEMVHYRVPLHTVIHLEPAAYDCNKSEFVLGPDVKLPVTFTPKISTERLPRDSDDERAEVESADVPLVTVPEEGSAHTNNAADVSNDDGEEEAVGIVLDDEGTGGDVK